MRFMAQAAGIDIAVYDLSSNGFGFGRDQGLSGNLLLSAVASGAARCSGVTGAPFLDELVAREAGNLSHSMLVHGHLGVAMSAREAIDRCSVILENMALVTS